MGRGYRDNDSRRYFDWLYYANLDLLAAKTLLSDERCYNGADYKLSFSKMTFPHQLMRVILSEQIYRSYRIINHEPYHK